MKSINFYFAFLFILAFGAVAHLEREDVDSKLSTYCSDVRNCVHPDYNGVYVEQCGGEPAPKFEPYKFAK